jgi:predicted N-acetyltransferase YhbS
VHRSSQRDNYLLSGYASAFAGAFFIRREEITMNTNDFIIRSEKLEDYRVVEELVRESFWNVYRPGCLEHYVLHTLRDDSAFISELDFVMEKDGRIIGQNMFMKAEITADNGETIPIVTMGPICIANDLKRKGYGKKLLDYSLEKAAQMGFGAVCFEGNIDFYGKSGFRYASEFGIRYHGLPEGADSSFFLCKELKSGYLNGVTGEYATPKGYFVDEKEAEEFDKTFPEKEKLVLPGQIFQ